MLKFSEIFEFSSENSYFERTRMVRMVRSLADRTFQPRWALQHVDVTPRTEGKIKITIRVEDGPYLAEAHVLVVSEAATAPLEVHSCDIPVDAREAKPLACVRVTDGYQGGTYDGG